MRHVPRSSASPRTRRSSAPHFHRDARPCAPVWQGHPRHHRPVVRLARYALRRPPLVEAVPGLSASKVARHTIPPVLPIPAPAERFAHVHVDVVGPFSPDQGKRYLLMMIDRTMRWAEALPIANTTADTVLQTFLEQWISRFGIPITVTTDRGAQFTSQLWHTALQRMGIRVSATTAYHPQANGVMERFHQTLKNTLRCAIRSSRSWTRSLPWVLLGLRNAPRTDTATSTAKILYGTPLVPGQCFQDEQSRSRSAADQLDLARSNPAAFSPRSLDLRKFKDSPFVASTLRTA